MTMIYHRHPTCTHPLIATRTGAMTHRSINQPTYALAERAVLPGVSQPEFMP